MNRDNARSKKLPAGGRRRRKRKEPLPAWLASFVELFIWLLVLKTFFLPLFIIPTGSMAETLAGAHATHTCPNCGCEYMIGPDRYLNRRGQHRNGIPQVVQCPNCRYQQPTASARPGGVPLELMAGDRIVVLGWPFDVGGSLGPRRWDVVVFKNPNAPDVNYIKRVIGLPGETIEIIDGDIFVKDKEDEQLRCARKTPHAQQALWFAYYDHDYPPKDATADWATGRRRWPDYYPHWVALQEQTGWSGLQTRTPRFDGLASRRGEILFLTDAAGGAVPGPILDVYGYNARQSEFYNVTDVRLSTDVFIEAGDGYVELNISKYDDVFRATLHADGLLTLERESGQPTRRQQWGSTRIALPSHPIRLALGHADYQVTVEVDGRTVLKSPARQYDVTPETARLRSRFRVAPAIGVAAERVQAAFAHLLIERDVYYVSGELRNDGNARGIGTQGNPITLGDDAYFVCGDNSPNSLDSRAWTERSLGLHLRDLYQEGRYKIGTVPADQMVGRAVLVYWPGAMPLPGTGLNILPNFGRMRWIH